jgi:DNA polymerase I-like protein with 3'-5' exonuclease and polymerase domains
MVIIGLVFQWHRLKRSGLKSFLISTVHDSTIGEVHPDEIEEYERIAKQSMEDDVFRTLKKLYNYEWITPLEVEGEYYNHWGDK